MESRLPPPSPSLLRKAGRLYRHAHIESATGMERLLMAYDAALKACENRDRETLAQALSVLKNALDLDKDPLFALGLLRLYLWCEQALGEDNFEAVAGILSPLRTAWQERAATPAP